MSYQDAAAAYNINYWSDGYFSVSPQGDVMVNGPDGKGAVSLPDLVALARKQNLSLPLLVRFPHILHDRVRKLNAAFRQAMTELAYEGRYTSVYPIKVNQQRRVVEEIIKGQLACMKPARVGLEAGSKPELLAVLTEVQAAQAVIICNGYKDEAYIELALIAEKMGHETYLVIEKASELPLVLKVAERLGVSPRIGLRARLASVGKGYWQNTGGEKSKFGLTAQEILHLVHELDSRNQLQCLQLLHFHLGSQIANISDIHRGLQECSRFFTELVQAGAGIRCVDVGGGLGVDYEGTRSRSMCSMNYSVTEYARAVVSAFASVSRDQGIVPPDIISESGRAVTAHHAVLVTDIIERESPAVCTAEPPEMFSESDQVRELLACREALEQKSRPALELYHEISHIQEQAKQLFCVGQFNLQQRADVDNLSQWLLSVLRGRLDPARRHHVEVIWQINERLADKLFVNFSLFQSLPDVWGLEQIFPVMPLSMLNQPLSRRAVIQDITCDSDGRIDHYVDGEGVETTLAVPDIPAGQNLLLGFFMVGAYQEILGDMHNLFGDTDSVDAGLDPSGRLELQHGRKGDTMADVLRYVDFRAGDMLEKFGRAVEYSSLDEEEKQRFLNLVRESFESGTYLNA